MAPRFYMYTSPQLDHSWLRSCAAFRPLHEAMSEELNFAEIGLYDGLVAHPSRTADPSGADLLYYVPIWEYTSSRVGSCRNTTHKQRMSMAAQELAASPHWRRSRDRHFFVSSAYSLFSTPERLAKRLGPMHDVAGVVGRYKSKLPAQSRGAPRSFAVPYPVHAVANRTSRARAPRDVLAYFSGSLDVCCTGKRARCLLADVPLEPDVVVNSVPRQAGSSGPCARRYEKRVQRTLQAAPELRGNDDELMGRSVFCLAFAGDNCISQRFYNALVNGCIPVVSCGVTGAFHGRIPYAAMTIRIHDRQNMTEIVRMLRGVNADAARIGAMRRLMRAYAPLLRYDAAAPSEVLVEAYGAIAPGGGGVAR